jgi:hypothetical protein
VARGGAARLVMTYNFDPDRWYEDQRRLLELRRRDGTLDDEAWAKAEAELDRRYEDMLARLDATYQLRPADSKQ